MWGQKVRGVKALVENNPDVPTLKTRHVAAATIGNALEFYDFLTYAFFSIQIGHAFFPAQSAYGSLMLSLATFGAGFVTRPIGALVIGAYADRVGRRPAMMLCFVMIGCSIVAMALIPTYGAIGLAAPILAVLARMVQGFSLGGEIGSNTAYLMEAAPTARRGLVVSWQGVSQNLALIAGGLVGTLLTAVLPPAALDAYGWRIAFLLGAAAVPFGLWLRTNLPETLHRPVADEVQPVAPQSRLGQARTHWRVIGLGLVVLATGTIGNYIFAYLVTYAQDTLHMSARAGFIAETAGNVLSIPAMLLGGWLSDRHGRRPVNVLGNLAELVLILPVFLWVVNTHSPVALIVGMSALSVAFNFNAGSFYACLAESLPQTIRGSGFGTVYSVSIAAFGGTTQLVVTWLIHVTGSAMAPAWYLMGATAIGQVAVLLMRESAPVRLGGPTGPLAASAGA
jgi:MHS family citrate/tricarballylate:H+ symporter-like MFS transporter